MEAEDFGGGVLIGTVQPSPEASVRDMPIQIRCAHKEIYVWSQQMVNNQKTEGSY